MLEQECKNSEGLFLKFDPDAILAKLTRREIHLEYPEAANRGPRTRLL
jgi:hypothetical protein